MLTGSSSPPPLPLQEDEVADTRSPYQAAELHAASLMKDIREYITLVDKLTPSDSPARRLELNNSIRKAETELRTLMLEARRLAVLERRVESYGRLQQQSATTQQLIRAHYGTLVGLESGANHFALSEEGGEPTGDDEGRGGGGNHHGNGGGAATHYDIATDREFQDFFMEIRQNDAQIDAALDRIEFGVQRVNENAQGIRIELQEQRSMLKDADKQASKNEAQLGGLNKRLLKTIKKLGKSRLIVYAVLCVVLIVLIIVIIFLGKSI